MVFTLRIAETLAEEHEVVVIRPSYNPKANSIKSSHPKVREIFTAGAPIEAWEKYNQMKSRENFEDFILADYVQWSQAINNLVEQACRGILANNELFRQIEKENFDLVFHHHLDYCLHGVVHAAGVRKWVSTMPLPLHAPHLNDLGIPYFNSFLPGTVAEREIIKLPGLLENSTMEIPTNVIFKEKYGQDFIDVSELSKRAILSFVNSDPFLEYPIPTTNKVQYIGGLGMKNPKPLKEPFLSFSEKAKTLVVVSFGSVVTASDMPEKWRNAILGLFRLNPEISFIWKFEKEIEVPENVLRTAWFPQNDVLALNKTVAFVTHGGYNSLGEAVYSGTPCVFIPLSTDQHRNSMLGQFREIGLQLPKREISSEQLNKHLHEILSNPKYKESTKKYRQLADARINSPEDILLHWTRLVLDHELNFDIPAMTTLELYNIDVYLAFFGILSCFVLLFLCSFHCICRGNSFKTKRKSKVQ